MGDRQGLKTLLQTGLPVRLTSEQARELWRVLEDHEHLSDTAKLAYAAARAKGRHHSQHAMCDLMEHFGLPCVRPGEEAPAPEPVAWMYQHDETGQIGSVDQWQIDNGFEDANPRLHVICPLYRHPPS